MPFDPPKPANNIDLSSQEIRNQLKSLKSLKSLIDAVPEGPPGPVISTSRLLHYREHRLVPFFGAGSECLM